MPCGDELIEERDEAPLDLGKLSPVMADLLKQSLVDLSSVALLWIREYEDLSQNQARCCSSHRYANLAQEYSQSFRSACAQRAALKQNVKDCYEGEDEAYDIG